MTNPTTNFGWVMPTATDLVTDLPADFNVFGQAVDTDFVDLLGGTTGQILSKTSATDLDFTWIANDQGDITAVNTTAPLAGGATSGAVNLSVTTATTSATGVVQLSDSTSTTSSILAATPTAVKSAYDLANDAIAKTTVTTAGDIIYRNATVPARLGIGTASQVLAVNSGATAPEWVTPTSGGMTQLATGSLSGATTSITGISGSYKNLQVIVRNFDPTSDGSGLQIRLNQDATASRNTTGSNYGQTQGGSFTGTTITLTADVDNSVNQGLIMVNIYDYANATTWKMLDFLSTANNPTTTTLFENRVGYGVYNQTAAISSFDFIVSGGAAGGTYFVYGVK